MVSELIRTHNLAHDDAEFVGANYPETREEREMSKIKERRDDAMLAAAELWTDEECDEILRRQGGIF